jgi:hypothetical protein
MIAYWPLSTENKIKRANVQFYGLNTRSMSEQKTFQRKHKQTLKKKTFLWLRCLIYIGYDGPFLFSMYPEKKR